MFSACPQILDPRGHEPGANGTDLGDPGAYDAGPLFAYWDRMREKGPIQRTSSRFLGTEFWSVTGWQEIRTVLGDDSAFASRYGIFLGFGPNAPDPSSQRMLVVTDGIHRRALRSALQGFFSAGQARAYTERLVEIFRSSLMHRIGHSSLDFARDIAWQVPIAPACWILGVPEQDSGNLCALANGVLAAQDPSIEPPVAAAQARAARAGIIAYFRRLIRHRTRARGDDVISALLGSLEDGPLPPEDVALNLLSLLVAACETSRLALTGALVAFAHHPDQWTRLRADPSLRKTAIEEILRWTSPGLNVSRTAMRTMTLAGAAVSTGDVVTAWLPAGNRDPAAFPAPYAFDVARTPNPHVAFGHGPHHCIGAALARVEIAALLSALLPVVEAIEVAGPLRYTHSNSLTGYASAPLRLHPAAARAR